ncbi:MAG: [FeFe] hydrogenase H-cluster maturation GTPase HydF [Syntrophomonadaceae bacterium]|nr:[FeFe] hydrogenase H-cluster maturation GTPase HydF [Syntrophomonadaceae bacterium]
MEATSRGMRLFIAIFGRRNTGKSSLINALTKQDIALVSPVPGTTTDPVYKSMEILPIGPVVLIDTAGIDDEGELGRLRVERTMAVLNSTDLALLVIDQGLGFADWERQLLDQIKAKGIPVVGVVNKTDLGKRDDLEVLSQALAIPFVPVSALTGAGIEDLKMEIIRRAPTELMEQVIIGDLLQPEDLVVLVVPIDAAAPKGRLILPQVQVLRDLLDHRCMAAVVQPEQLSAVFTMGLKPKLVVTDSQAFALVNRVTPSGVQITSFSILFARYKGDLATLVAGAKAIDRLQPGDRVLIAEACTHHRVKDDIGSVKLPKWLKDKAGGELNFEWSSGKGFPPNLTDYSLVIHCGACMINRREMLFRIMEARKAGVPIVNYGVAIAHLHGILSRTLTPFPKIKQLLEGDIA